MRMTTEIVQRVNRAMQCSRCGASAAAACDCGVAYLPANAMAVKGIKEHPDWSNRRIAAETGVSISTVRRIREAGGSNEPPETRTGRDGKEYPATRVSYKLLETPKSRAGKTVVRSQEPRSVTVVVEKPEDEPEPEDEEIESSPEGEAIANRRAVIGYAAEAAYDDRNLQESKSATEAPCS
jgi:hypothetical protein